MEPVNGMQVAEYIRTNKVDVDIISLHGLRNMYIRGIYIKLFLCFKGTSG